MITEKAYGSWSIIKDGKLITALITIIGTGAQQVTSLGDSASLISYFIKYPVKLRKIDVGFEDLDNKVIEIDRVPLSITTQKSTLLKIAATTDQSHALDAEPGNIDVFSTHFRVDFIITYTAAKKYDITVMLEEAGE